MIGKRLLRQRVLVDRTLQGRLCLHGLLHGWLVLLVVCLGVFAPVVFALDGEPSSTSGEAAIVMLYMHEQFWPMVLACAVVVVFTALLSSHRIAGPLVRYKRNLRLVARGQLPPALVTRGGDLLKEEVACLNEAVAGVAARVDGIRSAQLALRRQMTAMLDGAGERERAALDELVALCDALERAVLEFRHVDPGDDRLPEVRPTRFVVAGAPEER